jgi:hypothetical protein
LAIDTDSVAERSVRLQDQRLSALVGFAEEAAACHGQLTVVFYPGQSTTRTMWSGTPWASGGTAIAAERRSVERIDSVVAPAIRQAMTADLSTRPPSTVDPLGVFEVLAELRSPGPTAALVLSSFIENSGGINLDQPISVGAAEHLAHSEALPSLAHAHIEIQGVGETKDAVSAPDDWLGAVRAFSLVACRATRATCTVDTQVTA